MTESSQPKLLPPEINRLMQLRNSMVAFQKIIGTLPADEQSNAQNIRFNQWRQEAKSLLNQPDFEEKVTKAVTTDMVSLYTQKFNTRLLAVVILGVILALLGLGVNSIILDEPITNSLACLVSTGGILLIIGALGISFWGSRKQPQLTNLGALYLLCDHFLEQLDQKLGEALPDFAQRPAGKIPDIPSTVTLTLDSLRKQSKDWQEKLTQLKEQHRLLGMEAPAELAINIDFIERELERIRYEIKVLGGQADDPPLLLSASVSEEESADSISSEDKAELSPEPARQARVRANSSEMLILGPNETAPTAVINPDMTEQEVSELPEEAKESKSDDSPRRDRSKTPESLKSQTASDKVEKVPRDRTKTPESLGKPHQKAADPSEANEGDKIETVEEESASQESEIDLAKSRGPRRPRSKTPESLSVSPGGIKLPETAASNGEDEDDKEESVLPEESKKEAPSE